MRTIIYSTLVRLWGNKKAHAQLTPHGTLEQNGTGTLEDFDDAALDYLASLGVSHLWPIGIIRHATQASLRSCADCPDQHPDIVKGQAGSPYAITDYYDFSFFRGALPSSWIESDHRLCPQPCVTTV